VQQRGHSAEAPPKVARHNSARREAASGTNNVSIVNTRTREASSREARWRTDHCVAEPNHRSEGTCACISQCSCSSSALTVEGNPFRPPRLSTKRSSNKRLASALSAQQSARRFATCG